MALVILGVLLTAATIAALIFRNAFRKAIADQMQLANLTMEVRTSDQERERVRLEFLNFILEAQYPDKETLLGMASTWLIDKSRSIAHRTVPANRDIYWAMNKTPELFFENGDPSKPRRVNRV